MTRILYAKLSFVFRLKFMLGFLCSVAAPLLAYADYSYPHYIAQLKKEQFVDKLSRNIAELQASDFDCSDLQTIPAPKTMSGQQFSGHYQSIMLDGLCHGAKKAYEQADRRFSQALSVRASSSDALFFRGLSKFEQQKLPESMADLDEALWFSRFNLVSPADAHFLRARIFALQDLRDKSLQAYRAAISADPNSTAAKIGLAETMLANDNSNEAIPLLRDSLTANPNNSYAELLLAKALLLKADRLLNRAEIKEANELTDKLVKSKSLDAPTREEALRIHVKALLFSNKQKDAAAFVARELKRAPDNQTLLALNRQVELEGLPGAVSAEN